jgi:hypothetical protein
VGRLPGRDPVGPLKRGGAAVCITDIFIFKNMEEKIYILVCILLG